MAITSTIALQKWAALGRASGRPLLPEVGIKYYISTLRNRTENQLENNNSSGILSFRDRRRIGYDSDADTCGCLLQEFANMKSPEGKVMHAHVIKKGIGLHIFVSNNLVNMYAKCGIMKDARRVFDEMPERDVVSWNAMIAGYVNFGNMGTARKLFDKMLARDTVSWNTLIAGYAQNSEGEKALKLFCRMHITSVDMDRTTFASVLKACASLEALVQGLQIHNVTVKMGLDSDVFVGSALVDMYGKCRRLSDARKVFDKMPEQTVVLWNAMIAGYAQNDWPWEAFSLLIGMLRSGLKFSQSTFATVLKVCASLGALEEGMQVSVQIRWRFLVFSVHAQAYYVSVRVWQCIISSSKLGFT